MSVIGAAEEAGNEGKMTEPGCAKFSLLASKQKSRHDGKHAAASRTHHSRQHRPRFRLTNLCDITLASGRQSHHDDTYSRVLNLDADSVSSCRHGEQVYTMRRRRCVVQYITTSANDTWRHAGSSICRSRQTGVSLEKALMTKRCRIKKSKSCHFQARDNVTCR